MGNTRYFLSNSREIPVFPAGMGNTHKSRDFANPALKHTRVDDVHSSTAKIKLIISCSRLPVALPVSW